MQRLRLVVSLAVAVTGCGDRPSEHPEQSAGDSRQEQVDGIVLWRVIEGPTKGKSALVVLNFENKRVYGFASNDKPWFSMAGTFEVVR